AYHDRPGDPPTVAQFPLRLVFTLRFTAPVFAPPRTPDPPPPDRACGTSPAGCHSTGCPGGMRCDTTRSCVPSSCGCDASTGHWICTADCGGGTCVPTR